MSCAPYRSSGGTTESFLLLDHRSPGQYSIRHSCRHTRLIMLARHLLFLATRRNHSHALLNVPIDSVLPECPNKQPPPPYIEPPTLKKRKENEEYKILSSNLSNNQQLYDQNSRHSIENDDIKRNYEAADYFKENTQQRAAWTNPPDTRQHVSRESFERNAKLFLQRQRQNCTRSQKTPRRDVYDSQTRGEQFSSNQSDNRQQFYTLPAQRPQRIAESPRSVTPDIMRGLGRGPLSTMHVMAKHGQNVGIDRYENTNRFGSDGHLDANEGNGEKYENQRGNDQQCENRTALDLRNRFKVPTSLAAIGYRFIASSSMHDLQDTKSPTRDSLRHTMLSPIDPPTSTKGFQSSTPGCKSSRQIIDTSIIKGVSPLGQTTSGRNTPTNVILSPTKSTMSNEELFAAIHKSKKRLNIREEAENLSPSEAMTNQDLTGYGWSPESHSATSTSPSANPRTATSRLNFKRLLLQQSVKTGPTRLSAAEQLKLTRQQNHHQHQQQQHALAHHQPTGQQIAQPMPAVKVLSPRATWRFQSPRSDVLSSTIIEDSAAEEKAMKPSPEFPSPISRTQPSNLCTDGTSNTNYTTNNPTSPQTMGYGHPTSHARRLFSDNRVTRTPEMKDCSNRNDTPDPRITHSSQVNNTSRCQTPENLLSTMEHKRAMLSAAETRRINNQLARAQFLAGSPVVSPNSKTSGDNSYLWRHNRARSESPQHGITENVSRSPSAPALETAL